MPETPRKEELPNYGWSTRQVDIRVSVNGTPYSVSTLASYEVNSFLARFKAVLNQRQIGDAASLVFDVKTDDKGKIVQKGSDIRVKTTEGFEIQIRRDKRDYVRTRQKKAVLKASEDTWRPAELLWRGILNLLQQQPI